MTSQHRYARRLLAAATVTVVAAAMVAGAGSASAAPATGDPTPAKAVATAAKGAVPASSKLAGGLASLKSGRKQVFVQVAGSGAADASAAAAGQGATGMKAAANSAKSAAKSRSTAVLGTARSKDSHARQLFQVGNAVPGFAVDANAAAISAMAASADVVKITPLVPKNFANTNGAELTNVLRTWQNTGTLGAGVKVGIIDTGLDYTHADFGGQGTDAAWEAAHGDNTSADWYSTLTAKAQAKVGGGYDFVGDDYNPDPAADDYQPVPHPDADPIGCDSHGTHVAGILAGYGENADGSTFTGNYRSLNSTTLNAMKVSPGMAPAATIYPLKVFGCTGGTDEVMAALDWALDPNGDGNFADHLDIVNLSLGSDYSAVDDPENAVVDQLSKHGVLPVISIGNGGDLTDIGGSPGNAVRSLAVASSVDADEPLDGLKVNAPADVAGVVAGQFSAAYDWANADPVTGDVVALTDPTNSDGCAPFSAADAALVANKVAWLTWNSDDAERRCGSAGRSANVVAAGGIGAIFTGDVDPFTAGITGSATIPVFQLTPSATAALQPAVNAGTLNVTFDGSLALTQNVVNPAITDTISSFSSRGTHGSIGVVKPDVSAPGDSILSAGLGTGDGGLIESGTSMAAPHTAGIAALVKATHKNWSAEQVKAAVMNTAGHDLYSENGQTGPIYGPARDGAGRVDALAAVSTSIIAYDTDRDIRGGVSASFGVVEAPITTGTVTKTRTVTIQNTGKTTATLHLSYAAAISEPGVSYKIVPSTVRVGAKASATVTVVLTVKPSQLRHSIDPTMETDQLGIPRNYLSDASGRLLISQTGKADLRVPVYAAVKPVSKTTASDGRVGHGDSSPAIKFSGKGFDQGSDSTAWTSLVSVMDLGASSPKLPACRGRITSNCTSNETTQAGDIQYVGAGSSAGWLYFGISTYGSWADLGAAVVPYIQIDTNHDGRADYEVDVQLYPDTDVLMAELFDLSTGENLDLEPVNFQFGDVDTNVFDNNVLVVPVDPSLLGLAADATTFPISYTVSTASDYAVNPNGDVDATAPVAYDVVNPKIQVDAPLYSDQGDTAIPYTLATGSSSLAAATTRGVEASKNHGSTKPKPASALVLHLHGSDGQRAQVLTLRG